MKGFTLGLALKQRRNATQKLTILNASEGKFVATENTKLVQGFTEGKKICRGTQNEGEIVVTSAAF